MPVKLDLSPEEIERIVKALEHYSAYLKSQQRTDSAYDQLADWLRDTA